MSCVNPSDDELLSPTATTAPPTAATVTLKQMGSSVERPAHTDAKTTKTSKTRSGKLCLSLRQPHMSSSEGGTRNGRLELGSDWDEEEVKYGRGGV